MVENNGKTNTAYARRGLRSADSGRETWALGIYIYATLQQITTYVSRNTKGPVEDETMDSADEGRDANLGSPKSSSSI